MFDTNLVLIYTRNNKNITLYPVKDINHARQLANEIYESDLFNEEVVINNFDLGCWDGKKITHRWRSDYGLTFNDIWTPLEY